MKIDEIIGTRPDVGYTLFLQIGIIFDESNIVAPPGWELAFVEPNWEFRPIGVPFGTASLLSKMGNTPTGEAYGHLYVLDVPDIIASFDEINHILLTNNSFTLAQTDMEIWINNLLFHSEPPCP